MDYDVIIIGAGAAGMMAAAVAGQRGARVLVVDHAKAAGDKIRISGGGRCNFTNMYAGPENFLSQNSHFCKSALSRFGPWDFVEMVDRHGIGWHEKTLGQLFCDNSAKDIIAMLLAEMETGGAELSLKTEINRIEKARDGFRVTANGRVLTCAKLVVACGGKSIPKMGATGFGYEIAQQFDLRIVPTRAGLVPFTFQGALLDKLKSIAGVAIPAKVTAGGTGFDEALLFTHRGLSGPAVLQASSYWEEGAPVSLSLLPDTDLAAALKTQRQAKGGIGMTRALSEYFPKRLAALLAEEFAPDGNLADQSDQAIDELTAKLRDWQVTPSGTEGYRTAEVTLGGVDTNELSSKTMETKSMPGLYFIGEVVDVTGWLGGFNFQWAWASAVACGQAVAE
ncbi:NAD(P)/FAD-dependent oxidoreductase [Thalassobius sp. I31.1]|uniref:NAD(P)/FAD-dependent oxidoreductase n=1 Tax=Thalassobius sp. I31.1 TaxID=2109912 RepID=UPI000D1BCE0C|nr:NAD(P)/FAD-dependent oxidoreductase [Thalassobius sp. I31.1]